MRTLLTFLFIGMAITSMGQSFSSGTKLIDARFEFGAYATKSHDKVTNTNDDGGAASKIFNAGFEYGVLNWLSGGIKFQYDNYIVDPDTTSLVPLTINQPTVHSLDYALMVNTHLGKKDHYDMTTGLTFGLSSFIYNENDVNHSLAKGTGTWFDLHMTHHFYFGEHIGINLNLAYAHFNYANLNAQSDNISAINSFSLSGSGVNIGGGLSFKF